MIQVAWLWMVRCPCLVGYGKGGVSDRLLHNMVAAACMLMLPSPVASSSPPSPTVDYVKSRYVHVKSNSTRLLELKVYVSNSSSYDNPRRLRRIKSEYVQFT